MRKGYLLLALILLIAPVFGLTGQAEFQPEAISDGEYDGYILKLKEAAPGMTGALGDLELTEIYAGDGLFVSDNIPEILELADADMLEYIEPNYKITLQGTVNDPYYSKQWNLDAIGITNAWDQNLLGQGVRIAVIDSGVNVNHEEFVGVDMRGGVNLLTGGGDVTDTTSHGSQVCGIIAAMRNNGKGLAGLTDKAVIIPFKCFDGKDTNVNYVISAVKQAVEVYDCDVINLSLGSTNDVRMLREALDDATSKGVIVVASAGNYGGTSYLYPAAYDNVVGVGSVGRDGSLSSFSQRNDSVFVVAPGDGIITIDKAGVSSYTHNASGTSFSAPHVTAMAAMAKSYDSGIDTWAFQRLLRASAVDKGAAGYDTSYGYGMVNIKRFVEVLTGASGETFPPKANEKGKNAAAQAVYKESGQGTQVAVSMSDWFFHRSGASLRYLVYASTADGQVQIKGDQLIYTPSFKDAEKTVRIVVSAADGQLSGTEHAVLSIRVESDGLTGAAAEKYTDARWHWAKKYIACAVENNLFIGTGDREFSPDLNMDRAMFVTVLGRLSGADMTKVSTSFSDVPRGSYYYGSVAWAQEIGLVTGLGGNLFGPGYSVSREQLAVFMYRYATGFGISDGAYDTGNLYGFSDVQSVSDWARDAVNWAVSNALISGKTAVTIDPRGSATRAEVSAVVTRFLGSF